MRMSCTIVQSRFVSCSYRVCLCRLGSTTGATGGLFGASTSQPAATGFGTTPAFGASNVFGASSSVAPTPAAGTGFSFGTAASQPSGATGGFGGFGQAKPATGGLFGRYDSLISLTPILSFSLII